MENLVLAGSKNTPEVNLSVENCQFEIRGSSYSDRAFEQVYSKVLNWVELGVPKLKCELNCIFYIDIMNSISYKNIMQIMIKLVNFYKEGKKIKISWFFEGDDEDNEELAEDMSSLFDIPFIIKPMSYKSDS